MNKNFKSLPTKADALQCAVDKYLRKNEKDIVYRYHGKDLPPRMSVKLTKEISCVSIEEESSVYDVTIDCNSITIPILEKDGYSCSPMPVFTLQVCMTAKITMEGDEKEGFIAEVVVIKDNAVNISTSDTYINNELKKLIDE